MWQRKQDLDTVGFESHLLAWVAWNSQFSSLTLNFLICEGRLLTQVPLSLKTILSS